jgi:hypothetical protein
MSDEFTQVCVWPGTLVEKGDEKEFEQYFLDMGFEIKFIEVIFTAPDLENGHPVEGTGGRSDVFFYIHNDAISRFAVWRLIYGIRWIEDVLAAANGYEDSPLYPERVREYCSWSAERGNEDDRYG